ncbi:MAG: PilZ domain-containing protein [Proteobacteria bacterium]|nr:PilZ domain-containing protein [Pseudomonadota bacterium]
MNEHRRKPRRHLDRAVEVEDVMTEAVVGWLGNLSESGMLIQAGQTLVEDGLYQFRFSLIAADGNRRSIEVGAHHLWAEPAATPGQSWIGFRFIDLSADDTARVREWVAADASAH